VFYSAKGHVQTHFKSLCFDGSQQHLSDMEAIINSLICRPSTHHSSPGISAPFQRKGTLATTPGFCANRI
jgi:hypothetical protein